MNASRRLTVAIVMLATSACSASSAKSGDGFEGEIDMVDESALGPPATSRYFIKGERVRVETTASAPTAGLPPVSTVTIIDISTNDVFVLDAAKKSYRAVRSKPPAPSVVATAALPSTGLSFRSSAKGDVVAGVSCASKSTSIATGRIETCACDGLDLPARAWSNLFGADPSGAFVLRRTLFDTSGKRVAWMEANRIERALEPSTLFVVPAGYMLVK